MTKRSVCILLALTMVLGWLPHSAVQAQSVQDDSDSGFAGKTISILGASMSTFGGTSNGGAAETTNSTIADNVAYYPNKTISEVALEDTWWMQAVNDLGLRLLVNNSWSGSSLLHTRSGTEGAYVDRCVQLHDDTGDNAGEMPDIIAIQMGTNDYQYYKDTLGTADIDYDTLIVAGEDGTYTYAEPTTSLEAAAIVMHKISIRYPDAEVYYLNLSQRVDITDETAGILETFNENLAAVCAHFGVTIVDIYNSGITQENFDTFIGDGRVHPNKFGMDAYTEAFKKALLGNHEELTSYTVDFQLSNVTPDYGVDKQVLSGKSFTCTLTAPEYFKPEVTVTMGGEDITDSCYADGVVTIEAVTADVVITAEAVLDHEPQNYRWEFDGTDLATVTTNGNVENVLTKLAGSSADGVFTTTSYSLEKTIVLSHDLPWSVEWKSEGTWKGTSTSGGRLFSTAPTSSSDTQYIFKSVNSYIIAMGNRTSSGSYNYGIALADHDIDGSERHIYRLENRIAEDGSNMVWLYVDGIEIGAMNNLFVGTTDQETTSDWLSGQDFLFPYIGTETHGLNNCSVDYVQVWEGGADHYHTYTAEVTEPTYNEGGYTTYTCTGCGESYVADHTDPIALHTYRWELVEDAFVPVTTDGAEENVLSLKNGSITDGAFTNVLYNMDTSVHLYHDQPWVIEWKSSGDNSRTAGSTSGGSGLLSSNTVLKSDEGTWFLYKRPSTYLIALCYRDASTSIQSGIALADHGIDGSELHTYRLENRVAEDGSNMVYLIVDGVELGAMNNLFVSAVDQGETTDFLNGLDWTFDYMGITSYYLNNCSIEYMQIWEGGDPTDFEGKTIACVGDSITAAYGVTKDETDYVTLLAEQLGMDYIRLGASGTTLCTDGSRTCNIGKLTEANLQGADVVTIAMGINDFCAAGTGYYELGDIDSTDTSTIYGAARMWCERIVELRKTDSLSHAQFYFVTPVITSWNNSVTSAKDWDQSKTNIHGYTLRDLCNAIIEVAALYDVAVIDLNLLSGMYYVDEADNNTAVFGGDGVHPGEKGHEMMAAALANVLLQNNLRDDHAHIFGSWITTTWPSCVAGEAQRVCSVCSATESSTLEANGNHRYSAVVTAPTYTEQGYTTYTCSACGDSYVSDYTDAIQPHSYRWEMQDNTLVSVTTGGNTVNSLTQTSGSITNGTLTGARYTLDNPIRLQHNEPWVIEWRSSGDWDGMLFGSTMDSSVQGLTYLFRYAPMDFLALGDYTGTWNNYGVIHSIDMTVSHVFRLENRIAEDGSNTVYLLVDGQEIDAMHHYYVGGTNKNQTVNWANGKDIVFANMGTSSHPLKNMALEYLQVWEGGHEHTYESAVTAPTCTEAGYTTYTCDCGGSYVDDYTDAVEHSYENGSCTVCGAKNPGMTDWSGASAVFVGDSITAGSGTTDIYYEYLNESLEFGSVTAMGVAGSCISAASDYGQANQPLINRYQNIPSADLIVIFMGTNDYGHETPLGSMEDTQDGTFYGALNTIIPALVEKHFPSKIVFVTPLHRYGFGTSKILGTQFTSDSIPNGVGSTLGDYVEALKKVCANNDVSVIDLYTECTLDPADSAVRAEYMPDGLHPNAAGHELIAGIMESHIRSYERADTPEAEQTELIYGNKFASGFNQENRASSRVNQYLKAGTIITLKNPAIFQWACTKTSSENSCDNLGYFPDGGWSDQETAVVEADGWVGFVFKYRDETEVFDLTKPLSDYITIEAPHTHTYESSITAPTCTEQGYTTHTCTTCGDSYVDSYVDATGHTYENGICLGCGAEHPNLADFRGKVISIMGDSISTFAGYIPVADGFNREHLARYPQDNLLTDVNETWWMQVVAQLDAKLGINESWRGSTLSGAVPVTTGDTGENAAMSNLIRIQNMGSNGTPDVILLYGGTNDLAHVSKVGTFDPATAPTEVDLTTTKWDNLADGFVHTLLRMRHFYPEAIIVAMLPTYTASYYSDEKLAQGNEVMAQICEHYNIPYVDLRDSGVTADHLPDGIHPGEKGMDLITEAVLDLLLQQTIEPGENVVYPVTHELTHVKASLGHYKGVSAGKSFVETLTGEDLTVTVTMGGEDITASCYVDGKITIGEVSGALVITATGKYSLDDHLQQLPDPYCSVNLWQVLEHDPEYYSADGWTTHSSGQVKSITFPVTPGDRLYASSFEAAGTNGGTLDGIRVTYFTEDGVLVSMTAAQVYAEFSQNGCLTVPKGATAISIPMWTDSADWDVHFLCILDGHLQQIPEGSYNDTNLWPLMEHDTKYYSANGWDTHSSGGVKSVTFPVSPGDRLCASSFGASGTNGSTTNGIRVTYFTQCGVLVSLTAAQVYGEFTEYGYLTVPDGAYAVSIPMWTDSSDWELYVLTLPDRPVISVDVSWGAMEFTYTDGVWDPETHTYGEGSWSADDDSNFIAVANTGNTAVSVRYSYKNTQDYQFTGTFFDEDGSVTGPVDLTVGSTKTAWFMLSGRPKEEMVDQVIGTVTVNIE